MHMQNSQTIKIKKQKAKNPTSKLKWQLKEIRLMEKKNPWLNWCDWST